MKKEYIYALALVAILAIFTIAVIAWSVSQSSKPNIVFIDFQYYEDRPSWGLLTIQNVGKGGHVKIISYGNEILFEGYLHGGQILKIQTGWWSITYINVEYEDGTYRRIAIP